MAVIEMKHELKVATVFSGIGAPEQALKRLGIPHKTMFACDNGERLIQVDYEKEFSEVLKLNGSVSKREYVDKLYSEKSRQTNFVQQSYLANYKVENNNFFQDVKLLDGTDFAKKVDLFIGGSPCQSFSIAGSRGGFEDTRGTLFYDYIRLVSEIKPKVFIYENVYGVLTHDKGRTWQTMQNVFSDLGYHFAWKVLDARDYGIPQGRRRLFVVGFCDECAFNKFTFPNSEKLEFTMQDFLEDNLAEGCLLSVKGKLSKVNPHKGAPEERYFLSEKLKKYVLAPGTKNFMHPDAKTDLPIARALVKNMGNTYRASVNNYVTTNGRLRALTQREALRLMGYPDDYRIIVSKAQTYKQAGNSIVVDVMMAVIRQICNAQGWC